MNAYLYNQLSLKSASFSVITFSNNACHISEKSFSFRKFRIFFEDVYAKVNKVKSGEGTSENIEDMYAKPQKDKRNLKRNPGMFVLLAIVVVIALSEGM